MSKHTPAWEMFGDEGVWVGDEDGRKYTTSYMIGDGFGSHYAFVVEKEHAEIIEKAPQLEQQNAELVAALEEIRDRARSWLPSPQLTTNEQISMKLSAIAKTAQEALATEAD